MGIEAVGDSNLYILFCAALLSCYVTESPVVYTYLKYISCRRRHLWWMILWPSAHN